MKSLKNSILIFCCLSASYLYSFNFITELSSTLLPYDDKWETMYQVLDYASESWKIVSDPIVSQKEFVCSYGFDALNKFLLGFHECNKWTKVSCLTGAKNFLYGVKDIFDMSADVVNDSSHEEKIIKFLWLSLNKFTLISFYSFGPFYWVGGNRDILKSDCGSSDRFHEQTAAYKHYVGIEIPF